MFQFYISASTAAILIINIVFIALSAGFLYCAYRVGLESKIFFTYLLIMGIIFGSIITILDLELAQVIYINFTT